MRFALTVISCLVIGAAHAITADELVQKNIEAHGGLAAIKAINNIVASGKMTVGGGDFSLDLAVKQVMARPAQMRTEASFQGMTQVNAFDGKESWGISPFGGRKDPQRNSADQAKAEKYSADIEGVLVDAKAKGYAVEYLGLEDVDGTMAHKLRVKLSATDSRTVFLDPDFFLEIRFEDRIQIRGSENVSTTDLGDYEKVNGWFMPFAVEAPGQKITIEKIEANQTIDPAQFSFPTAAKK
jgi:outer membrane lipoprotein-sorting protein